MKKRYVRKSDLEALLNLLQNLLVLVGGDEGDGETLGAETAGTTNTMQVRIGVGGQIVVDGKVDALDIDTTTKDVGGHANTLVELLELLVPANAVGKLAPSQRLVPDLTLEHTAPPG